jgi:hypothetical protein
MWGAQEMVDAVAAGFALGAAPVLEETVFRAGLQDACCAGASRAR